MSKGNILVTGGEGQLGKCLKDWVTKYDSLYTFYFTDINELDITSKSAIYHYCAEHQIEYIINCAGYTAVDLAETEVEAAYLLNRDAVQFLAEVSHQLGIFLVHISTDFVFDEEGRTTPFVEDDQPSPLSIYGKSKLGGEELLRGSGAHGVIIRTAWLYSEYGHNFVKTMLRLGSERSQIQVVADQLGSPTYAGDLAEIIMQIITQRSSLSGVTLFHYSHSGSCSWYQFAEAVMRFAQLPCDVVPIPSDSYPTPAKRPHYSVLSKEKIEKFLSISIPDWEERLENILKNKIIKLS
ncbi:MAG TPA: dTDP-4-dehydrorhamnose reductase [Bacteroidales bacterium]|nr:dTDP-4-dehydrorhamnose reductase [Bacteroidales bacterium]HPB57599.1 dTDP-4-dehydrorhamnose reductase [Bacteroidales bacterium]HPZ04387.1 dTDP-4-dehydrorhamnose reductase [Bacteroidales bacterium]HQB75176.1 dTDP-4-dehydrorhamnose reductase [Bacteroidales bacterium]HQQ20878.1 dTDP-4-dehydrorhamnose reductase [Bacteroidales bacterium]